MALDPNEKKADEVIKAAEKMSDAQKAELVEAERAGKNRVTVLEALGVEKDPEGTRRSGTGRILNDWEADPVEAAKASLGAQLAEERAQVAETLEAGPGGGGGGVTPAGTGAAPAAAAGAGTGAGAGDTGLGGTAGV